MPPQTSNHAAYLTSPKAVPLQVKEAAFPTPGAHEIVVRNQALAINPVDHILQTQGTAMVFPWLKYPIILGYDIAGIVHSVGSSITLYKPGDRVLGNAVGIDKAYNRQDMCGFQEYTVLLEHMTTKLPDEIPFTDAVVVPLGLSTAACGLFQDDQLKLNLPTSPKAPQQQKTLVVWGASTSVGCNAIQLAVAGGYSVFATASPRNFPLLKKLGVEQVFDYSSATVLDDIVAAMTDRSCAGALSITNGSNGFCVDIVHRCKGSKFVSMATPPLPAPSEKSGFVKTVYTYISGSIALWLKAKTKGIKYNYIFGTSLVDNGIGKAVYQDYLGKALESRSFVCAPEPQVVGRGLESIQEGFEVLKTGISAKKVIVTLY